MGTYGLTSSLYHPWGFVQKQATKKKYFIPWCHIHAPKQHWWWRQKRRGLCHTHPPQKSSATVHYERRVVPRGQSLHLLTTTQTTMRQKADNHRDKVVKNGRQAKKNRRKRWLRGQKPATELTTTVWKKLSFANTFQHTINIIGVII